MNQSIQVINQLPITQEGMSDFTLRLLHALNEGEVNPLDLKLHFKALDLIRDVIKSRFDELALKEAEKNGKSFDYKGFNVKVQELGTKFDYSGCGDLVWQEIEAERVRIEALQKGRQDMLKTLTVGTPMIHPETGETFEAFPPIKRSTTGLVLTLKKDK